MSFELLCSHRRPIRPHVTLLLGLAGQIQATDTRTENKATESETPDFETERITEDAKRFSWGLSYTRDRFQITGAASSTIRLDVPFVAMDARFFF